MSHKRFSLTVFFLAICTLTGCQPLYADGFETATALPRFRRSLPSFLKPIINHQDDQVTWIVVSGPASAINFSNGGTVSISGPDEIVIRSQQTVSSDFFFEVTLPSDFGTTGHLPYIGLDPYPINPTGSRLWGINSLGDKIRVDGQSELYPASPGDRIAMEARGGVVRYYKNHAGPTSIPFYVSRLSAITSNHNITLLKPIGGTIGDRWVAGSVKLTR